MTLSFAFEGMYVVINDFSVLNPCTPGALFLPARLATIVRHTI